MSDVYPGVRFAISYEVLKVAFTAAMIIWFSGSIGETREIFETFTGIEEFNVVSTLVFLFILPVSLLM